MLLVRGLVRISQGPARGLSHYSNKRAFSYVSSHRTFPATLYRFQTHRDSRLFNRAFEKDDWEYEDGIKVSEDGLVHPTITIDDLNGALFMPNTHFMQQIARRSWENYLDGLESGQLAAEPHYLCIPKGTNIPKSLNLFRERESRFSLLPACPISLDRLNHELTRFYLESGRVFTPDDWLGRNPYHEAFFDHLEEWMER